MSAFRLSVIFTAALCAATVAVLAVAPAMAGPTMPVSLPIVPKSFAKPAEPFGLLTTPILQSPLAAKWREVERSIEAELQSVANCRVHYQSCASPQARLFLAIVDEARERSGLARLGIVNRAINLAIQPRSDRALYGVEDHWNSPLATLAAGAGDCEDYAIAKFVALREAGVAADDLRLVIVRDIIAFEDHALLAARLDGRWHVLDNRNLALPEDIAIRRYRPMFAIDAEGAKRFESPAPALVVPVVASHQLPLAIDPPFIAPLALGDTDNATSAL